MRKEKQNLEEVVIDPGTRAKFLAGILDKQTKLLQHLDSQTNILIGISSAMFAFMTAGFRLNNLSWPQIILGFFSALTALLGLYAIHPPRFMRKKGQKESVMYSGKISDFSSPSIYKKELGNIVSDQNKMLEQYSIEIYNVAKYYYDPKRKIFKIARNILLIGFFISIILFLAPLFS
ncbi:MAG: hypothetical protein QG620_143 [Patescibacteria group bacterium]|nr:hypothetical protein [Patescibacteria group bacterium]